MRIEFILTNVTEVSHFAPVIHALRSLGADANCVFPYSLTHSDVAPFGWSDRTALERAIADEHLPLLQLDLDADAAVTTHPATYLTPYRRAKKFRMMYGMGLVDSKSDHEIGLPSDFHLVHGPLGVRVQFSAHAIPSPSLPWDRVKVIGYPRLDGWWSLVKQSQLKRSDKPTLLYLPTWTTRSSIDEYIYPIAMLSDRFHIMIKPHHCTSQWEPERVRKLDATGAELFPSAANIADLAWYADLILADLASGAYTEALLIGKPVVGLGNEKDQKNALIDLDYLPSCTSPKYLGDVIELARDTDWNDSHFQNIRDDLFTTTRGNDGMVAAKAILECLR
jgi:hypothetical protein